MTKCLNFTIREQKLSVGPKKRTKSVHSTPHRPTTSNPPPILRRSSTRHHLYRCRSGSRVAPGSRNGKEARRERRKCRLWRYWYTVAIVQVESRRPHRRLQRTEPHKEANGETTSIYSILHTRRRNLRTSRTKSKENQRQQTCWWWHSTSPINTLSKQGGHFGPPYI